MNLTQFAEWLIEAYHSDDGMPEAKEICREARAALSAQPVEGADAESKAMFVARLENMSLNGDTWLTIPAVLALLNDCDMLATQAAPAPEPSAQAVAHPSHQTVREWMPVSEALRLSDLWTAGDLDNCGQWRAAIKVLADEVRALAASPQPAEPSAQGEPVAWRPGDPIYDDAYVRGVAVGFAEDDSRRTTLLRIADRIEARASAPSTPPHAVVEAVPLEWTEELGPMPGTPYNHCAASTPFGRFLITWKGWKENDWPTVDETPWGDFFGSWRTVKEAQAACEAEYAIRLLRGIAPKAAQPN